MSITDELRELANSGMSAMECATYSDKLIAIADRIDAAHERLCSRSRSNGYGDGFTDGFNDIESWVVDHKDEMAKHGWLRLPVDSYNVPWNVGDLDEDGKEVIALKLTSNGWYVITDSPWPYRPDSHRHYHAPTVEDVLWELLDKIENFHSPGEARDTIAEYAAKLRLKEDE